MPTPTVALTGVAATRQMSANVATVVGAANASRPPHQRLTRYAPTTASSVLPAAIAAEVAIDPAVVALTISAAMKMAGQAR